jgi:uncharacterized repeat protein (TIGR03803 family)
MKKQYVVFYFLLFLVHGVIKAQYTDLFNFADTNGASPYGSLTLLGNKFYGMTLNGGKNGYGTIFSINADGTGYKVLWNFDDTGSIAGNSNGAEPYGNLTFSGGKFYGMTSEGGAFGLGCIFSIDTNGSHYRDLLDFNGTNGAEPEGNLTLLGNRLFGMTYYGGAYSDGLIFSIDTSGNQYKDLLDFNGTNGNNVHGSLTFSGNVLYGMTYSGGAHNKGCIFLIDTNGSGYLDLFDFDGLNGSYPIGNLLPSGGKLYGMTSYGGTIGYGNIFSIDMNGSNYKNLLNFNATNGSYPWGSLILYGKVLYGMTYDGGAAGDGTIFGIDTNGANFVDIFDLDVLHTGNGMFPYGDLTLDGGRLYGMTSTGGAFYASGAIFSIIPLLADNISVNTGVFCFGDSTGSASVNVIGGNPPYKYSWSPGGATTSTVSGLTAGTYTVKVKDSQRDSIIDSVKITQSSKLQISTSSTLSQCNGSNGTASVSVLGGASPYTYRWFPSGGTSSTATGLSFGFYTCSITDSLGCSASVLVNVRDSGTLMASIVSLSNPTCFGDTNGYATLSISGGMQPYIYLWSPSVGTDTIAQHLGTGTYTFVVTDSKGCKADTLITITQPPSISIISNSTPDNGSGNGTAWVQVNGGTSPYTYLWTGGNTTDSISGKSYGIYCCTITDVHGCTDSVCVNIKSTVGIDNITSKSGQINLYPNPNNGQFTLSLSNVSDKCNVEVYNVLGERVKSEELRAKSEEIDLSGQPNGIYLYQVITENGGLVGEGKVVIQK